MEQQTPIIDTSSNKKDTTKAATLAKDPKKVAAGKALAKKNAEARKKLGEANEQAESKNEAESQDNRQENFTSLSFSDLNNSIQSAAGIVGAGFVLYHGFKFFYPNDFKYNMTVKDSDEPKVEVKREVKREVSQKSNMIVI